MPKKTTINTAHAEIARDIRLAKQRAFRLHEKGIPLSEAFAGFVAEVQNSVSEQSALLGSVERQTVDRDQVSEVARVRNNLAAAVAEIVTNDAAPPRLRDAAVNHIADAPPYHEPATETREPFHSPVECPTGPSPYGLNREVGGYRILTEKELDYIVESIGGDSRGSFHTGTLILLLDHLVALHLGAANVESEVITLSEKLLAADNQAIEHARHALKRDTYQTVVDHLVRFGQESGDA